MHRTTTAPQVWPWAAAVALALASLAATGAEHGRIVASREPGWPQFRGPLRNGVSAETGLLQSWPEGGPPRLWQVSGLGRGYCSPIVTGGTLYITGDVGQALVIFAFDLDGKLKWKTTNGQAWRKQWPGSRASCTYDGGRLYHMNAHGRTVCLDPSDGKELWAVDVQQRFGAPGIQWGRSECVLIDGDRVIVTPGGPKALMAALDKKTGETVWQTAPLRFERTHQFGGRPVEPPRPDTDKTGYASPILFELGGRRLIAGCSARHLFIVDAEAGKLLWSQGVFARFEVIGAIPVFWRDSVFFTAPDDFGGMLLRIRVTNDGVRFEEAWRSPQDNCHGAMVVADGRLYGSGYRRDPAWACVDLATGKVLYKKANLTKGSTLFADGRLYALAEDGVMALLEPTDTAFKTAGRFRLVQVPEGRRRRQRDVWPHPVLCGGRLYLRYHDTLSCYDVRKR